MDEERANVVLTNKQGGFAWLAAQPESRYQGVFFRIGSTLFKAIAHLGINQPLRSMTNQLWSVQREYDTVSQRLTMPHGTNTLLVELSSPVNIELVLDCRIMDDYREWGRTYTVKREQGCVLITFRKRNDSRDDNKVCHTEFDLHLAIVGDTLEFFPRQEWVAQQYPYDAHRKSKPSARWVFNAGTLNAQRFVVGAGLTKAKAIAEAKRVFRSRMRFVHEQMRDVKAIVHPPLPDKQADLVHACARHALNSLAVDDEGLYAGIPWFYQFWMRDEAISCNALRMLGRDTLVRNILLRHLATLCKNPVPLAFEGHALRTIDGPCWVGVRYAQHKELFSAKEQKTAEKILRASFSALKQQMKNGLVTNGPQETWMDTAKERAGARIEIQALMLALAQVLGEKDFERELKERVRETLWNGQYLLDGLNDPTVRPNVFIAAYAYPELLSREEWERCFDAVLPKLWLSWGGLTTIAKDHPSFVDHYTGEDNASYHHGDSWFWLNNLAVLVLHRTNAAKYKKYIDQILEASSYEILALGAIGNHGELSSARALSSHGCVSQAWSAAMFIELCNEIFAQK